MGTAFFPKCQENNFNLIFPKGFHSRKHIGTKTSSVDLQRPVDFLITLHIAGRSEKYTGIKRRREARESMPENGELRKNMEGKRNNRVAEESDKGRENEMVEMRSLQNRRKAEKHNCYKGKGTERRGRERDRKEVKRDEK